MNISSPANLDLSNALDELISDIAMVNEEFLFCRVKETDEVNNTYNTSTKFAKYNNIISFDDIVLLDRYDLDRSNIIKSFSIMLCNE